MDGTTCDIPSDFTDFTIFNYAQPSIFIYGNRGSDVTSNTRTLLSQFISSINTPTTSSFLNQFNSVLKDNSISSYFKSISLQSGPLYDVPALDTTSKLTVSSDLTTITVAGLALSNEAGVFYGIASNEDLNLPTQAQIRAGLNSSNTDVAESNAVYIKSAVTLTFKDLSPGTTYMVYYYASNADRTQYARVTRVYYLQATTQSIPGLSGGSSRMEVSVGMLAILLTMLFMM